MSEYKERQFDSSAFGRFAHCHSPRLEIFFVVYHERATHEVRSESNGDMGVSGYYLLVTDFNIQKSSTGRQKELVTAS